MQYHIIYKRRSEAPEAVIVDAQTESQAVEFFRRQQPKAKILSVSESKPVVTVPHGWQPESARKNKPAQPHFNKYDQTWENHFLLFQEFLHTYHRLPASKDVFQDFNLGVWFTNQLRAGHAGTLSENRVRLLTEACHLDSSVFDKPIDRSEWSRSVLLSSWKEHLRPADIPIDSVFSGEELYTCLSRGIYSCRDYIDKMETVCAALDKFGDIMLLSYPAAPDLFCRDNAQSVFSVQFPVLDFSCFNLYIPVYTTVNPQLFKAHIFPPLCRKPTLFEAAIDLSAHSRFNSAAEMCDAYDEVISSLNQQEQTVIRARFMDGQTYHAIGEMLGLTVERIRQVSNKACRKMRQPWRQKQISPVQPADTAASKAYDEALAAARSGREATLKEQDLSKITIRELNLSVRAFNCLNRAEVNTLKELASYTESDLYKLRNVGRRTVSEIRSMLQGYGLDLAPEPVPDTSEPSMGVSHSEPLQFPPSTDSVSYGEIVDADTLVSDEDIFSHYEGITFSPDDFSLSEAEPTKGQQVELLNSSISVLNLPSKSMWTILRAGINTVGDLVERTPEDLSQIRNCGKGTIADIKYALSQYSLSLKELEPAETRDDAPVFNSDNLDAPRFRFLLRMPKSEEWDHMINAFGVETLKNPQYTSPSLNFAHFSQCLDEVAGEKKGEKSFILRGDAHYTRELTKSHTTSYTGRGDFVGFRPVLEPIGFELSSFSECGTTHQFGRLRNGGFLHWNPADNSQFSAPAYDIGKPLSFDFRNEVSIDESRNPNAQHRINWISDGNLLWASSCLLRNVSMKDMHMLGLDQGIEVELDLKQIQEHAHVLQVYDRFDTFHYKNVYKPWTAPHAERQADLKPSLDSMLSSAQQRAKKKPNSGDGFDDSFGQREPVMKNKADSKSKDFDSR